MEAEIDTTIPEHIRDLVQGDRIPKRQEGAAIRRLCEVAGYNTEADVMPYDCVRVALQDQPEVFLRLAARHQEALQVMVLATLIAECVTADGLRADWLQQYWKELPTDAHLVFPESTPRAISALAELGEVIPTPPKPSHLARALIIDGATVEFLTNHPITGDNDNE